MTEENGTIVSANSEDFTKWDWATNSTDAISVSAANLVLKTLIEEASMEFNVNLKGDSTALFTTFEYEVMLECKLTKMMENWLTLRGDIDNKIPPKDDEYEDARNDAANLLRDLEAASAMLRAALCE